MRDTLNFRSHRLARFRKAAAATAQLRVRGDRDRSRYRTFRLLPIGEILRAPDEVRHYFTPHHAISELLEKGFGDLLAGKTCSVHVRRTDYVDNPMWTDLSADDYYERAMEQFDSDCTFVIFSDDIAWCRERFRGRSTYFVEALSAVEDLYLMSRCRGHIIANSSFSWWGAWLDPNPDKKVIAPSRWFTGRFANPSIPCRFRSGRPDGYHDARDLIPPAWIKI